MRGQTILVALLCLPALADCAPILSSESQPLAARSRRDCGFPAAERRYWRQIRTEVRTGISRDSTSSFAARACGTPVGDEIALTCSVSDAMSRHGDDAAPLPLHRVRAVACGFANEEHSRATCTFEMAPPGDSGGWRRTHANFVYIFALVPDESGHASYWSGWQAETGCGEDPPSSSG